MKIPSQRFFLLLPLLLTVVLIIFGEALGDLWKEDVKALFQQNKWLLLAFVGLLALVGLLWERRQNNENPIPETVDKGQYDEALAEFRKNLLEQYQTRLHSKTGRRLPINLAAKSTNYGFDTERAKIFLKNQTIESENIASEIDQILTKNGRLLLIGDPGAGKTTILLYAALNILNNSDEPKLPLILNLATWNGGQGFADWYAQNIAHTYSLSPVFVRELLRLNAIVPFFDGFDEVAEEHRDDCLRQMAADFGDDKRRQLIVSSRKKEYAAAQADAPVYAEIEVLPLSLPQIKKALSENAESQAADGALLHAIEHDKWLAEAVETPFYLNTASFLFGKGQRTLADFPFRADGTEGRQAELVEMFVAEQAPEERDRKHLSFLAGKMEKESFLVFELVSMQPRWCENLWRYRVNLSLSFSFLYIFYCGWMLGIALGFILGFIKLEIRISDIQIWSWPKFRRNWKKLFVMALATSLISGLAIGIIGSFLLQYSGGISFGIIFGTVTSIAYFLVCFLKHAGNSNYFSPYIHNAYKRFWANLYSQFKTIPLLIFAFILGVFITAISTKRAFLGTLAISLQTSNIWLQLPFSILKMYFIIPFVLSEFLPHFILRLVLYLEGKMPLRVVTFMDRMTEQLIFEDNRRKDKKGRKRRGATWRFRHKILQDYFARMREVSSFEERKR